MLKDYYHNNKEEKKNEYAKTVDVVGPLGNVFKPLVFIHGFGKMDE